MNHALFVVGRPGIDVDWIAFREEVTVLLDNLGADYYLKKSLTEL